MPLIKPSLIVITMLSVIWDFNVFNQIWLVSQGGPRETTATIGIFTYKKAFVSFDIGTGAATSVLVTLIPLALTSVYIRCLLNRATANHGVGTISVQWPRRRTCHLRTERNPKQSLASSQERNLHERSNISARMDHHPHAANHAA